MAHMTVTGVIVLPPGQLTSTYHTACINTHVQPDLVIPTLRSTQPQQRLKYTGCVCVCVCVCVCTCARTCTCMVRVPIYTCMHLCGRSLHLKSIQFLAKIRYTNNLWCSTMVIDGSTVH